MDLGVLTWYVDVDLECCVSTCGPNLALGNVKKC